MKKQDRKTHLTRIAKIVIILNVLAMAGYVIGEIFKNNANYELMPYVYFALVFTPVNLLSSFELAYNKDRILVPYLLAIIPLQFLTQSISFGIKNFLWMNSIYQAAALTFGTMLGWLLSKSRTSKRTK